MRLTLLPWQENEIKMMTEFYECFFLLFLFPLDVFATFQQFSRLSLSQILNFSLKKRGQLVFMNFVTKFSSEEANSFFLIPQF